MRNKDNEQDDYVEDMSTNVNTISTIRTSTGRATPTNNSNIAIRNPYTTNHKKASFSDDDPNKVDHDMSFEELAALCNKPRRTPRPFRHHVRVLFRHRLPPRQPWK